MRKTFTAVEYVQWDYNKPREVTVEIEVYTDKDGNIREQSPLNFSITFPAKTKNLVKKFTMPPSERRRLIEALGGKREGD